MGESRYHILDNLDIDAVRQFGERVDFGRTVANYVCWRQGFPDEFFTRLRNHGVGRRGQRILDLGTGTGSVARKLAELGAEVTGVDPAEPLLESAAELDRKSGVRVIYVAARAEELDFPDATFDVVIAAQSWHWFDRPRAASEAHRVIRPDGRVVIAHFDWLPLGDNVVSATEALILSYNPAWALAGGTGLYPQWLTDLASAGFRDLESFSFDVMASYTHEAWRGRIQASAGVRASLTSVQAGALDVDLAKLLEQRYAQDPLSIPHRVWVVIARAS